MAEKNNEKKQNVTRIEKNKYPTITNKPNPLLTSCENQNKPPQPKPKPDNKPQKSGK